jgi:hypothetical protein
MLNFIPCNFCEDLEIVATQNTKMIRSQNIKYTDFLSTAKSGIGRRRVRKKIAYVITRQIM